MNEIVKDYLWTFDIKNINNGSLFNTCIEIERFLKTKLKDPGDNNYGCFTSYHHRKYNTFFFACPELHKLYRQICIKSSMVMDNSKQYYMRCWVNVFQPGSNIDWHNHWPPEAKGYHGFYCVNTEGENLSYTDYRIPGHPELRVHSQDGLLVFGKSDGDTHRSSEWNNEGKPRVTIAFDIIPGEIIRPYENYDDKYTFTNFIPVLNIK